MAFVLDCHLTTGSGQNSFRPQFLHLNPAQTESKWSMAASTRSGSSVRIPASKLRVRTLFIPRPAPVRFAEPMYAVLRSKMIILKWTRGLRTRSKPVKRTGYRSKSSRKFGPGSLAWIRRTSLPYLIRSAITPRKGCSST